MVLGYVLSFFVGFFLGEWFIKSWHAYKKRKGGGLDEQERF